MDRNDFIFGKNHAFVRGVGTLQNDLIVMVGTINLQKNLAGVFFDENDIAGFGLMPRLYQHIIPLPDLRRHAVFGDKKDISIGIRTVIFEVVLARPKGTA